MNIPMVNLVSASLISWAVAACVDHTRLVGWGLNLLHVLFSHDACHEVGIHGLYSIAIDISDLGKGVGDAAGTALSVDDLTNPPLPIIGHLISHPMLHRLYLSWEIGIPVLLIHLLTRPLRQNPQQ